jgi:predicted Fe-Mo cluster-binding NifX family protein
MKVAVPIWKDRVSPVFDVATKLIIIDTYGNKELRRFEINIDVGELHKKCRLIDELGIDCIICGAISRSFLERLNGLGIRTIYGISGKVDKVINAYLNNRTFEFTMPGYHIAKGGYKRKWKKKRHTKMQGNCRRRR